MSKDKEKNIAKINNTILKFFGKPIKISEATPEQQELVEMVIEEWKELL